MTSARPGPQIGTAANGAIRDGTKPAGANIADVASGRSRESGSVSVELAVREGLGLQHVAG